MNNAYLVYELDTGHSRRRGLAESRLVLHAAYLLSMWPSVRRIRIGDSVDGWEWYRNAHKP